MTESARPRRSAAGIVPALSVEISTPASVPGRGGKQHKNLQSLISRRAEANGWRAGIEERTLDGLGSVDVALRKGEQALACEIGNTTSPDHGVGNIQKCLASGFARVLVVSPEKKTLYQIRAPGASSLDKDAAMGERGRRLAAQGMEWFSARGARTGLSRQVGGAMRHWVGSSALAFAY